MKSNLNQKSKQNPKIEENILNVIRKVVENISPEETFYIFDVEDVLLKFNNWRKNLPLVAPYYAVKCNPDPSLLRILSALGSCFDCASKVSRELIQGNVYCIPGGTCPLAMLESSLFHSSKYPFFATAPLYGAEIVRRIEAKNNEIERVLSLGVHPSRIIFANPAKLPSHLKYAADQNVNIVTADGEEELYKIKRFHPTADVLLRIRSDASSCTTSLGMKFGCNSSVEAPNLLRLASKLRIKVAGICFHVGTGCLELTAYKRAIGQARSLFNIARGLGFHMRILDIGGGFPGDKNSSITPIARSINEGINEYFPRSSGVNIMAEPGRYFATSAFTIVTYIHGKRIVNDEQTGKSVNIVFIPDGIFGSFNGLLFDPTSFHPIPLSRNSQNCKIMPTFICGPTSHPLDILTEKIDFPDLQIGDWILFENMGAYRAASARYFSGFTLPRVYIAYNGSILPSLDNFRLQKDEYNLVIRNGQLEAE